MCNTWKQKYLVHQIQTKQEKKKLLQYHSLYIYIYIYRQAVHYNSTRLEIILQKQIERVIQS